MTRDEYLFLKNWLGLHPKQQSYSPFPANELMQKLITAGLLAQRTTPDATNETTVLVTGYEVTERGEHALKVYQDSELSKKHK
jgi:hypothetical protein